MPLGASLLTTVKRLANTFGRLTTLRRVTYTPKVAQPWENEITSTDVSIRTIDPEQNLGIDVQYPVDVLIAGDIAVSVNDVFIVNGKQQVVKNIEETNVQGVVVVKSITFR